MNRRIGASLLFCLLSSSLLFAVGPATPTGSGAWWVGLLVWATLFIVLGLIIWLFFSGRHHGGGV